MIGFFLFKDSIFPCFFRSGAPIQLGLPSVRPLENNASNSKATADNFTKFSVHSEVKLEFSYHVNFVQLVIRSI